MWHLPQLQIASCIIGVSLRQAAAVNALLTMFITKPANGDALESIFTNTANDSSLTWTISLSNGLFIPLVILFVGARIFTRAFMTKQLFADDCECNVLSRLLNE